MLNFQRLHNGFPIVAVESSLPSMILRGSPGPGVFTRWGCLHRPQWVSETFLSILAHHFLGLIFYPEDSAIVKFMITGGIPDTNAAVSQ